MKRIACVLLCSVGLGASAKTTTLTGTGSWTDDAGWDNGKPEAGDTVVVKGHVAVPEGTDVVVNKNTVGNTDANPASYRQKGGTYTSGDTAVDKTQTAVGAGVMEFEDTDVTLTGWRFEVGRDNLSKFLMHGGTLTMTLTDQMLTSVWGGPTSRSEIELSNVTWTASNPVGLGYGSLGTNVLKVTEGSFVNEKVFSLGQNAWNGETLKKGWSEATFENCAWTNTGVVNIPAAVRNNARLVIRNSPFKLSSTLNIGTQSNTCGTVEIDGCAEGSVSDIKMATALESSGRLVLRNQDNAVDLYNKVSGYATKAGSEATFEFVNSPFTRTASTSIGSKANACVNWVFNDSVFTQKTGTVNVALGGCGGFYATNSVLDFADSLNVAYGNSVTSVSTGRLELVDCDVKLTKSGRLHGSNSDEASSAGLFGSVLIKGGTLDIDQYMVARHGTGESTFDGANVTIGALFLANMSTGARGTLRILPGTRLYIPGRLTSSSQGSATSVVEQVGGDVILDASRNPVAKGTSAAPDFAIGCTAKEHSTWRMLGGSVNCYASSTNNIGLKLGNANGAVGVLELKGGVFGVPYINKGDNTGIGRVIFDGGVLKATNPERKSESSFFVNGVVSEVMEGGATVDIAAGYTSYFMSAIAHGGDSAKDGGLVKRGAGTLVLKNGALGFTGDVIVEEGTLDMSAANFTLGPDAAIGGAGTLKAPAAGLTVNGAFALDPTTYAGTLTVDGAVTLGPNAKIVVSHPESLDGNVKYALVKATSLSGDMPTVEGLPSDWKVRIKNDTLVVSKVKGLFILYK